MPHKKIRMEDVAEGGFVNDRSGKATAKIRRRMGIRPPIMKRRGNSTMKKFRY